MPDTCLWEIDDDGMWCTECGEVFKFFNQEPPTGLCTCGKEIEVDQDEE